MAKLYLVRHGEAAATWDQAADPGLSEKGRAQAEAAAENLVGLGIANLITSPLRRCRETAEPTERRLGQSARIVEAVAEVPTPDGFYEGRREWLRGIMAGTWPETDAWLQAWRNSVIEALAALPQDTIVFSHFVAINVAVGQAGNDDHVVAFHPDHCSITALDNTGGTLRLVSLGAEGETVVR